MVIVMTNNDLKQISKLLDDRLDSKFDEKLTPIQQTLSEHGKMLSQHGKMLKSLKKDQSVMLAMLDDEQMKQRKRLNRIEDHLGFSSAA